MTSPKLSKAAIRTHTITADTTPDMLTGRRVSFTLTSGTNGFLGLNGTWETLSHMDFGNGVVGMGGMFDGPHGRTGLFMPYGTVIAFH